MRALVRRDGRDASALPCEGHIGGLRLIRAGWSAESSFCRKYESFRQEQVKAADSSAPRPPTYGDTEERR